jgi:hypothetical protein
LVARLASKIGELEQEAEERVYVWNALYLSMSPNVNSSSLTLNEALAEESDKKCFRLIGGVL